MRTKPVIKLPFVFLFATFCLSSAWLGAPAEVGNYKFVDANLAIGSSEGSVAVFYLQAKGFHHQASLDSP